MSFDGAVYSDGAIMGRWRGRDGRMTTRGENSRLAKLTEEQAQAILDAPRTGPDAISNTELANKLGYVSRRQISDIRAGRAWMHLKRTTT